MSDKIRDDKLDLLLEAILTLRDAGELYGFFTDLCTVSELKEMSKRFYAARLLDENRIYNEITVETGLSTATISRVNRCLKYGSDGYRTALDRLAKNK